MNGKILLDSTIAIDLLNGLEETRYLKEKIGKAKLYISIITRIELLSYSKLTPDDEKAIFIFLKSVKAIPLTKKVEQNTILLRRNTRLKIPDCVIAATALTAGAVVLSRDTHLLHLNWPGLQVTSRL